MTKHHTKITQAERDQIAILHAKGKTGSEIGELLNRHKSSINKELKRNKFKDGQYLAAHANLLAVARKSNASQKPRLRDYYTQFYVHKFLSMRWSPEIISGWLKRNKPEHYASHEAIYQYIYTTEPSFIGCLIRKHRKRYKKCSYRKSKKVLIPNRVSIAERPRKINERTEFGHWESDAICSKHNTYSLNVLIERLSRFSKITPLKHNSSRLNARNIVLRLEHLPPHARQSITYDNGTENVLHEDINKHLGTKSYFCEPYHSWEKGSVENVNGLIRIHIPKKSDLAKLKSWQIASVEFWLNHRPRKILGFRTPAEVFYELAGVLP